MILARLFLVFHVSLESYYRIVQAIEIPYQNLWNGTFLNPACRSKNLTSRERVLVATSILEDPLGPISRDFLPTPRVKKKFIFP